MPAIHLTALSAFSHAAQRTSAVILCGLNRLAAARRLARQRSEARGFDAAMLRDLGLSRGELQFFLSLPERPMHDDTCRRIAR
jgi:hypothetical protein